MGPTPPAAGSSSQLAASTDSVTAHGRRAQQPTVHLHISDVTPVRHAQGTLSIVRTFVDCAAVVQTAVLVLVKDTTPGGPLQRRSGSEKCSVRCRPIKQRVKIYRNFRSNPTFDRSIKYIFAFSLEFTANMTFGTIFEVTF